MINGLWKRKYTEKSEEYYRGRAMFVYSVYNVDDMCICRSFFRGLF